MRLTAFRRRVTPDPTAEARSSLRADEMKASLAQVVHYGRRKVVVHGDLHVGRDRWRLTACTSRKLFLIQIAKVWR